MGVKISLCADWNVVRGVYVRAADYLRLMADQTYDDEARVRPP